MQKKLEYQEAPICRQEAQIWDHPTLRIVPQYVFDVEVHQTMSHNSRTDRSDHIKRPEDDAAHGCCPHCRCLLEAEANQKRNRDGVVKDDKQAHHFPEKALL